MALTRASHETPSNATPSARVIGTTTHTRRHDSPSLTAALLPALVVLVLFGRLIGFVVTNVVNMPFMDEWHVWSDLLTGLDTHADLGTLFLTPYNGHRLVVVRMMLLALLPTGWSIYPQVSVTLTVSALWLGTLWLLYRRTAATLGIPGSIRAVRPITFVCYNNFGSQRR